MAAAIANRRPPHDLPPGQARVNGFGRERPARFMRSARVSLTRKQTERAAQRRAPQRMAFCILAQHSHFHTPDYFNTNKQTNKSHGVLRRARDAPGNPRGALEHYAKSSALKKCGQGVLFTHVFQYFPSASKIIRKHRRFYRTQRPKYKKIHG